MRDARLSILLLILLLYHAADAVGCASADSLRLSLINAESDKRIGPKDTYSLAKDVDLSALRSASALEVFAEAKVYFAKGEKVLLVISLMAYDTLRFWHAIALQQPNSDGLAEAEKLLLLPPDYSRDATLRAYFWNPDSAALIVTKAEIQIRPHTFPVLTPPNFESAYPGPAQLLFQNHCFELHYHPQTRQLSLADARGKTLAGPFQLLAEILKENDTVSLFTDKWKLKGRFYEPAKTTAVLMARNPYQQVKILLSTNQHQGLKIAMESRFRRKAKVVRQALVIPLSERPDLVIDDKALLHKADYNQRYYLGQGGFMSGEKERRLSVLQNRQMGSMQLDMSLSRLVVNLSFAYEQPMIRYPLDEKRQDYFEDLSSTAFKRGQGLEGCFTLWPGQGNQSMPRLMPIPGGAEAAVVWTEHADWTDLRTHKAVHFGCDTITKAEKAQGGFDGYGIRITKSVFYHNPEGITNTQASFGRFKGLHATLADTAFRAFISQLAASGHEIGLHTPEQHSSKRLWMRQALLFTQTNYQSTIWIDHGYNNQPNANRENMVADGLVKKTRHYSADLWRKYGIKYLWNPALEEIRPFEKYAFDGNFIIPYPGFGPVLPHVIFSQHPAASGFLLWNTSGTLELPTDALWDYAFSPERLERLMQYHSIWINHVYPAWTLPDKGFWTYDSDSNLVAMPGFNRALALLSKLQNSGRLINTTLSRLAAYHELLRDVELVPLDDGQMLVINHNPLPISGLSFATTSVNVHIENHEFYSRRHGNTTYFWFDLEGGATTVIRY